MGSAIWIAVIAVVALALLVSVNSFVVGHKTRPTQPDVGRIVSFPDGCDLHVREDGPSTAPTIVLLHGFAGSLQWWNDTVGALSAHHRVIRFDLLGHGGSAMPRRGYTMEHQAQLIDDALAQLGVRRALIVGHSMGGVVATALITRNPTLAAGVVLIGSPVNPHTGDQPLLARLGFVPMLGHAMRTLATDGIVERGLKRAFFAPDFEVPLQFVKDFQQMTYTSYVSSYNESHAYLEHESLDRRLAIIGVPLLALYGTLDNLVSPSSERNYEKIPGARVVAIPGAGHTPMVEKPSISSRLILTFAAQTMSNAQLDHS
jgi:pimeloyl-ACP methyl ester carboxylesterase